MSALPDYADALASALACAEPRSGQARAAGETVGLEEATGRVLAEAVACDRDLPPFNRAQMDGYAIRASDFAPGRSWPVVGTVPAGASAAVEVPPGGCVAIATGAPLPPSLDTVIQHELSDRAEPVHFRLDTIQPGHAVHRQGADARAGDIVLERGTLVSAHHLGIAAAVGRTELTVARPPKAALLTSGDEVIDATASRLETHQIRNSNRPVVMELLRRFGADPASAQHLPDDRNRTIEALTGVLGDHDLVITVGGISAGERDHFPAAFEAAAVQPGLRGAAIQPGKPIFVGRCGDTVVVGLPGNPVSVLACACLFVWPIVRSLLGLEPPTPTWLQVTLGSPVKPNPRRRAFRPAMLDGNGAAIVPGWAGSGDLAHTAPTDGLLELPVRTETVEAGATLRFLPWP